MFTGKQFIFVKDLSSTVNYYTKSNSGASNVKASCMIDS